MDKIKAGVIGTGNISGIYFKNGKRFESLEIVGAADIFEEVGRKKAEEAGLQGYSVSELLADPGIDMIINLTVPQAHGPVCVQALEAGKHVYVEKPLSATREEARQVLELGRKKGLRVGNAPDTFLGGGIQTTIKLIEDGWIGTPIGASAFMTSGGPESWHPNPDFFFQKGAGPMFDMGPYYLTAMIALFGPISRVTGSARISWPERVITAPAKFGEIIKVTTPTHIAGVLDFESGVVGTLMTSFDIKGSSVLPRIEVYGSEGTILVPDPNTFGGPVRIWRAGAKEWFDIPLTHGKSENARGIGAADMAQAILTGRPHRASGDLGYHVLDAMYGFLEASEQGAHIKLQSTVVKPAPLPIGLADHQIDL